MILLSSKVALPHLGVHYALQSPRAHLDNFDILPKQRRYSVRASMSILEILIVIADSLVGLLMPKNRNSKIGDTEMEVHNLRMIGKDPARYVP